MVAAEPLAKDSPLLGRDNVILSPHTAFYSVEALDELQTKCASDVARVLSGEKAVYPISAMMSVSEIPTPFVSSVMRVEPQWIDYNGHLNMAYYNVLFDRAVDEVYRADRHRLRLSQTRQASTMTAEVHVRYLREIHESDPVRVTFQLIDYDAKRIHYFERARACRRRLAVGHLGKHDVACRHGGEEGGAVARESCGALAAMKAAHAQLPGRKPPAGGWRCRRSARRREPAYCLQSLA